MIIDTTMNLYCHCNSGILFENCCEPFLIGTQLPSTAVQLMRSRYTAFTLANGTYLNETSIQQQDVTELSTWAKRNSWKKLEVLSFTDGKEDDTVGIVEFKALYIAPTNQTIEHHEKSSFIKKDQKWHYDKGEVQLNYLPITVQNIGRNDPCSCGSGKKFKKCCG
jgi:SEC-C motif-containing protein